MRTGFRLVAGMGLVGVLVVAIPPHGHAQERQGAVSISAGFAVTSSELREWDAFVDDMVRADELVLRSRYDDRLLAGRIHERFAQYYEGVPVHGADVSRQMAEGVTVSLFGTVHRGIALDTTPDLSAEEVAELVRQRSGASPALDRLPTLVVLPMPGGSYGLTYRSTMSNAWTYFLDAHTGRIVFEVNEVRAQSVVGTGKGVLGDQKKVSATRTTGTFQARDQLRAGEILTLDMRDDEQRLKDLVFDTGRPGVPRWVQSDVASDTDNSWSDSGVVDGHVHMGWTYDYFAQQQSYEGLDGANGRVLGLINNASVENGAFFIRPPFGPEGTGAMVFGDTSDGTALVAEDVVAHELMHGVTFFSVSQRTGNSGGLLDILIGELGPTSFVLDGTTFVCGSTFGTSLDGRRLPVLCIDGRFLLVSNHGGAVNEAYSDIFATAVEFFFHDPGSGPLKADYLIGEDVSFGPIRSLEDPQSVPIFPSSPIPLPDAYSRGVRFLVLDDAPFVEFTNVAFVDGLVLTLPSIDAGAVHWNSTILSHAFYLAIEGGQNRTTGLTVQGVKAANREQIERVFFRALTELMPAATNFFLTASVISQSAVDLFGVNSSVSRAVDQALLAVGL